MGLALSLSSLVSSYVKAKKSALQTTVEFSRDGKVVSEKVVQGSTVHIIVANDHLVDVWASDERIK